jgi:uncharacterized protein
MGILKDNSMKHALIALCLAAGLISFSCVSSAPPAPAQAAPPPEAAGEPDILSLIERGDTQGLQAMFRGKEQADKAGADGRYPLHIAAAKGSAEMVELLLAMGAAPDPKDKDGKTPLRYAVDAGIAPMAKALIGKNASLYAGDSGGVTPLDAMIAKELAGAILDRNSVSSRGPARETPLHKAVDRLSLESVRAMLALDPELNARDASGRTPLDAAFAHPNNPLSPAIAELLISRGATSSIDDFSYFVRAVRDTNYARTRFADGATVLHEALRFDHRGYLSFFLDRGVPVDAKNSPGSTALHDAMKNGRIEAARILLAKGADPNAPDGAGNSPLHLALPGPGALAAMNLLLDSGAKPEAKDRGGNTALHLAVALGYPPAAISALIARGAPVDYANAAGDTALFIAVRQRSAELTPLLVGSGSSVFVRNAKGESPLAIALSDGVEATELILQAAPKDIKDDSGDAPYHHAVRLNARVDTIAAMRLLGLDPSARNAAGDSALHMAVRGNQAKMGEALLLAGANPLAPNVQGQSPLTLALSASDGLRPWFFVPSVMAARDAEGNGPLHYAAGAGLVDGVRYLAGLGAEVDEANLDGRTAAMLSLKVDSVPTLRALLALGADPAKRDSAGASALHLAVHWNARGCLRLLAESGATVDLQDYTGKTPLRYAVDRNDAVNAAYLLSRGALALARDNAGETALHASARLGDSAMTSLLIANASRLDARDDAGGTALLEAMYAGKLSAAALLAEAGASIHAKDASGESPLSHAAKNGAAHIKALLNKATIGLADSDGRSALRVILDTRGDLAMLGEALALGAPVDDRDAMGRSPLFIALARGRLDAAALLANAGADPFARDVEGATPASLALGIGDGAVQALFAKHPDRADQLGDSALHYAAAAGQEQGALSLLALGADRNRRNAAGETPADVARRRGHLKLAELLAAGK